MISAFSSSFNSLCSVLEGVQIEPREIGEDLPPDPDRPFGPFGGSWEATTERRGLRVAYPGGNVWVVAGPGDAHVSYDEKSVTIGDSDGPCEVAIVGVEGNLPVEIWATVGLLECVPAARDETSVPLLSIRHTATVNRFVGCAELQILEGRLFSERLSRREPPGRIIGALHENQLTGGTLVGVDITEVHASFVTRLAKLAVCSPDVRSLYDDVARWDTLSRVCRRVHRRGTLNRPGGGESPRARAHWYRDLDGALRSQAVPATVRAAVRWCYAVLEHEAVKAASALRPGPAGMRRLRGLLRWPRGERFGRALYRLVGYGQRPLRAFTCWFLFAVGVTAWSASTEPPEGILELLWRFVEVLVSPLRVLRLGNQSSTPLVTPSELEGLAYVMVGVPFIFVVIALREFFRSPLARRARNL